MRPMKILDRFTRDRASRYVWAAVTIACVAGVVVAGDQKSRALTNEIAAAQTAAVNVANGSIYRMYGALPTHPIDLRAQLAKTAVLPAIPAPSYRTAIVDLEANVFTDPQMARVRVWTPDGLLNFSSHERDLVGVLRTTDTSAIQATQSQRVVSRIVTAPFTFATTGTQGAPTRLLETFVPLHVPERDIIVGAVQVDQYYDAIVNAAMQPWQTVQVVFVVLALLSLVMTALSLREPIGAVSAGAGLAPGYGSAVSGSGVGDPAIARIAKAELDAAALRDELSRSSQQLAEAREALSATKAELAAAAARAAESSAAPVDHEASEDDEQHLATLETRIASAEERARRAEARLAELEPSSASGRDAAAGAADAGDETDDLRSRLTRSAAKKKLNAGDPPRSSSGP